MTKHHPPLEEEESHALVSPLTTDQFQQTENLVKTAAWLSKEAEEGGGGGGGGEEEEMSIINKARDASFVRFSISISLVINSFVLSLLLSFIRPAF